MSSSLCFDDNFELLTVKSENVVRENKKSIQRRKESAAVQAHFKIKKSKKIKCISRSSHSGHLLDPREYHVHFTPLADFFNPLISSWLFSKYCFF